ncbi:hypothetical protein VOI54_09085 [Tamlana sp. 2201CG12-4]|uniref:hypothetical protein n=1 Tax=Tamlana sp. 2201CG12-4 TaxID=3112582 RepID=UPI002DB93FCD|nr:hypothetical protein [Tamlana sp. 2201CG12-4]MEC3907174.1 hypothetical protein [Tamlana sp. 2201CG12-4]
MIKIIKLITICLLTLVFVSCSNDDNDNSSDETLAFNRILTTGQKVFAGDVVTIQLDATGVVNSTVSAYERNSSANVNDSISVNKITPTSFEITPKNGGDYNIVFRVSASEGLEQVKGFRLQVIEHGANLNKLEGITINDNSDNPDSSDTILEFLGEPEFKRTRNSSTEAWYYFSKGYFFVVNTSTKNIEAGSIYEDDNWEITFNDVVYTPTPYAYTIPDSLALKTDKINVLKHGIQSFNILEGITIDDAQTNPDNTYPDLADTLLDALGEPELISPRDANADYWYYFSKGFRFRIWKSSKNVTAAFVYGADYNYDLIIDSVTYDITPYPYGFIPIDDKKFDSSSSNPLLIDDLFNEFGAAASRGNWSTSIDPNLKFWRYRAPVDGVYFLFNSDVSSNYEGKQAIAMSFY